METPILLLLLSVPVLLFLYYYKNQQKYGQKKQSAPGPPGLPFVGNLFQFEALDTHKYLWRLAQKYGPVLSMKLGNRPVLVISSPTVITEIMKTHDLAFSSRPKLKGQYKLSYNGMDVGFSAYNDSWREMRKISTVHLFSQKQVQSFRPIREDEVSKLIHQVTKDVSLSRNTNVSEMAISFTSNLICRVAFGKSFGTEGYEKARFYELLRDAQATLVAFYYEDYIPSLAWIDKLNGMNARLDKVFKALDAFYDELIEEHMDPNRPDSMRGDVLDLLLELRKDKSTPMEVTWEHIKGLVMDVFSGGTDTSAASIVWAMTALVKHPSIMKKAQEEIRSTIIGGKDIIDEDDVAKLPYLKAITKETFRLFPSTPLLAFRETIQKCVVNGYEVQPGTTVFINAWGIARHPDFWPNADEFMPDRFMGSELDVRGFHPEVIPFGIGRRKCPGIPMAMASVELALANLLYKFNWELPAGLKKEDIDYEVIPGVTMHKKNPLFLIPKPVRG